MLQQHLLNTNVIFSSLGDNGTEEIGLVLPTPEPFLTKSHQTTLLTPARDKTSHHKATLI